MAAPLVTKQQLEARIGAVQLQRCLDDNGDGQADKVVVDQLLEDASSYVRAGMPQHDPDDLTPANALITTELRRLALDACVLMLAERRQSIIKRDPEKLRDALEGCLDRLLKGQRSLGSKTNPAPADQSVSVVSGAPSQADWWP